MTEQLKDKFKKEIDEADWDLLKQHYERDALFVVEDELDIFDICVAVANDNSSLIAGHLETNKVYRPSEEQVANWEKDKFKKMAQFLIVQPYVFIKLIRELQ